MASLSRDNRDDTACDKCGVPASWADTNTSNLSWKQSLQHHLDTFSLSPRMWPIGYIDRSPYSPLRLEVEMPNRTSWRDAFEDLLAIESGGQMISLERRKKEADIAKRQWHSRVSREISYTNDRIKNGAIYLSLLKRMQDVAARAKQTEFLETTVEATQDVETFLKESIAHGKSLVADFEERVGENPPASTYKMRGQWKASLVSSGALPGWVGEIFFSSMGYEVCMSKRERNQDDDETDSMRMTEYELDKQFDEGIPMQLGSPSWSTSAGHFPEPEIFPAEYKEYAGSLGVGFRYRSSILSQMIAAERTRSGKQDNSTKVVLTTMFTDGATEIKEIVDDCGKIMEENERVYASMRAREAAILAAGEEVRINVATNALKRCEENLDLD